MTSLCRTTCLVDVVYVVYLPTRDLNFPPFSGLSHAFITSCFAGEEDTHTRTHTHTRARALAHVDTSTRAHKVSSSDSGAVRQPTVGTLQCSPGGEEEEHLGHVKCRTPFKICFKGWQQTINNNKNKLLIVHFLKNQRTSLRSVHCHTAHECSRIIQVYNLTTIMSIQIIVRRNLFCKYVVVVVVLN